MDEPVATGVSVGEESVSVSTEEVSDDDLAAVVGPDSEDELEVGNNWTKMKIKNCNITLHIDALGKELSRRHKVEIQHLWNECKCITGVNYPSDLPASSFWTYF